METSNQEAYQCQCQCQCKHDRFQSEKGSNVVTQVWWDFLRETTFHGCKNIEDRRRSVLYRGLWTLMVLGMLGGLLYTVFTSFIGYYEYRVGSKSRIEIYREMPFPAITVCSTASINIANKNISQTLKDFFARGTSLGFLVPPLNWSDPASLELEVTTMNDVMDEFTVPNIESFITHHLWRGSGNMTFKFVNTYIGKCFVANDATDSAAQAKATVEGRGGGLEMTINIEEDGVIMQGDMTYGAIIFVHDPREKARSVESGVMVAPGNSFHINLKPTKYKFLPAPYKSYGNSYCEDTDDTYSYQACTDDWSTTQAATHCNCTTGIEPASIIDKLPSCSLAGLTNCYVATHVNFLKQTLNENFTVCPKPCSFTRYETSVSFSKFPSAAAAEKIVELYKVNGYPHADQDFVSRNILKVNVYFDRFFMEHVMYEPEVTIHSILSSLGGQMGFFLGASMMTVVELGEAFLRLFWALTKKMTKSGNKSKVTSLQQSNGK